MKKKIVVYSLIVMLLLALVVFNLVRPRVQNYSEENIMSEEDEIAFIKKNLVSGGPEKDGIPAIENPKYILANESNLDDEDIIYGIDYKGFVAAYPQKIMFWHELVNEEVKGEKISISYCPLTETIIGYKGYNLGVSGELYNSNLVMYDRETGGRIPQIIGKFIEGEKQGQSIEHFSVIVTTWEKWKSQKPNTLVMSENTGYNRDYTRNPYPGYDKIYRLWFPVVAESDLLKTKDFVFGIENNGKFIAILEEGFNEKYPDGLDVELGGENLHVSYNKKFNILEVDNPKVKSFRSFWFAWYAYHPDTKLVK